ncbi:hypothetical protein GCM10023188_20780 [Pontibacter saemangeumensis]|uniref:Uncharacterized protein n=1 Tax=Pontibacter saemangeumensis TaxID=1084525 RepID=A0ABP8LNS0_9BACT
MLLRGFLEERCLVVGQLAVCKPNLAATYGSKARLCLTYIKKSIIFAMKPIARLTAMQQQHFSEATWRVSTVYNLSAAPSLVVV